MRFSSTNIIIWYILHTHTIHLHELQNSKCCILTSAPSVVSIQHNTTQSNFELCVGWSGRTYHLWYLCSLLLCIFKYILLLLGLVEGWNLVLRGFWCRWVRICHQFLPENFEKVSYWTKNTPCHRIWRSLVFGSFWGLRSWTYHPFWPDHFWKEPYRKQKIFYVTEFTEFCLPGVFKSCWSRDRQHVLLYHFRKVPYWTKKNCSSKTK